jgi:hypothetical protein
MISNQPGEMSRKSTRWIAVSIMITGAAIRLVPLMLNSIQAPFHLGGLFYEVSRQILQNDFKLPATIPFYSADGIPFLYPPLAFYLQALVIKLFNPPQFLTTNLLPALAAILCLPAFYWMIMVRAEDRRVVIAALFAFAFMPSAFINQIEGAGLAESYGLLAMTLYLGWLYRLEHYHRTSACLWAGLLLGACILSSPGSAYGGVILTFFLLGRAAWNGIQTRSADNIARLILVGIIGLLVSSPYWITILIRQDVEPFIKAFLSEQDGSAFINQIRYMITFKPADMITFIGDEGVYGFLFDWLIFAGLIWAFLNKQLFQILMFFSLWIIPREGCWLVVLPAALLAGWGTVNIVLPLLNKAFIKLVKPGRLPLAPGVLALLLVLIAVMGSVNAVQALQGQSEMNVSPEFIADLHSMKNSLPEDGHVLVVGNTALREWAPALLERQVINCEFGLEWEPDELEIVRLVNASLQTGKLLAALEIIKEKIEIEDLYIVGEPGLISELIQAPINGYQYSLMIRTSRLELGMLQEKIRH